MFTANKIAKEIPIKYLCPITQQIMLEPVLTSDGHTYAGEAIAGWLKHHNTSPPLAISSSNGDIKIWDISALYEEQQILNNLEQKIESCKIM